MASAEDGSTVKVRFTGKLSTGEVFANSEDQGPLEFTIGEGRTVPGLENAVKGMTPGESKTVTLPPEEAFGPHREDRIFEIQRSELPDDIEANVGQPLEVRFQDGRSARVMISDVQEETVKLDGNHPLAGQELTFDIELVEVS